MRKIKRIVCFLICLSMLLGLVTCANQCSYKDEAPSDSTVDDKKEDAFKDGAPNDSAVDDKKEDASKDEVPNDPAVDDKKEDASKDEIPNDPTVDDKKEDASKDEIPNDLTSGEEKENTTYNSTAEILETSIYLFEGKKYDLHYEVNGGGDAQKLLWTTSSDSVTVENGRVHAVKEGIAIVSAGGESVCVVNVLPDSMPTLSVNTGGVSITSKTNYVSCQVDLETENAAFCFEDVSAGIRIRGNSTSALDKKPYRIQFNSARNLLGMNQGAKCKSWVLLAEGYDDSMIRNATALTFASTILDEYSSDFRYVTLKLNGKNTGVYLLCEQSQIQKYRINIEEAGVESTKVESGYLYEIDASTKSPDFYLEYGDYRIYDFLGNLYKYKANDVNKTALFYSLKNNNLNTEQKTFAEEYLEKVFYILYSATYRGINLEFDKDYNLVPSDKSAEEVICAVIDVESLVRKYIHSEILCNGDEIKKSYYMYVDLSNTGTGLLTFTCPWDFDIAIVESLKSTKFRDPEEYFACKRLLWYVIMMNHEWFRERVCEVWQEVYQHTNGFANGLSLIPDVTDIYADEIAYDADKWERTWEQEELATQTYQWLVTRIAWLNSQFGVQKTE